MFRRIASLFNMALPRVMAAMGLGSIPMQTSVSLAPKLLSAAKVSTRLPLFFGKTLNRWQLYATRAPARSLFQLPLNTFRFSLVNSLHTNSWLESLDPRLRRQVVLDGLLRFQSRTPVDDLADTIDHQPNISEPPATAGNQQDVFITMHLYDHSTKPSSITPSLQSLSMNHIREIQTAADRHYEHMHKVSLTLQRLLAAGASDVRVTECENGGLNIKVVVPTVLIGGADVEVWLREHGIDPTCTHFKIELDTTQHISSDATQLPSSDIESFLSMLEEFKESSNSMFVSKQPSDIVSHRQTQDQLLSQYHAMNCLL
ncbi:hypothetical protein BATDEDRAFT_23595 [Batrachochytrium dendrobatidis JAM81]|uniref:Uncharacterized protein n=2 Tax=Batrachochytrium dendrobatidis TaxID=109871 RepID=F4NXS7_BATDJ|nr:uncharacterized protein BATDEDRAFT_23595 [Batrachochytrium dendrobatidis JAM81]EGF82191.1 hypothetical protein BATDEDRAFT_23595 [Batrachochytrium dendrobatidis JAM81]|eukprot:XP_006677325.1 hypothetical protein BATDEDRAFT_23595 [Batrachochytrium dendrobatidis JAM81]